MIIRSRWRRAGGLARHIERTDTNEKNVERADLCRHCPGGSEAALTLFTAISRTNGRTERDLIHIKISPSRTIMTEKQIERVIALIEAEHQISQFMPRYVRQHNRGDRPPHFHVNYPVVDPESGRAVRSQANYLNDEIASRLAELELGEEIVPGPRQTEVVRILRLRGQDKAADLLAQHDAARRGDRIGDASRQQAAQLGTDVDRLKTIVSEAWNAAAGDEKMFARQLEQYGLSVARGTKVILVVEDATGTHVPLGRALRQRAKEQGRADRVRERELQQLFEQSPPFGTVRSEGFERSEKAAAQAADDEMGRLADEAEIDGQQQLAARLRRICVERRAQRSKAFKRSLAERRRAIVAEYARRDRVRRARVLRAAKVAQMLGHRDVRRVGMLVAGTVILAGGALGLALIAAGIAVAVLPTQERVRAMSLDAQLRRVNDRDQRARDLAAAFDTIAAHHGPARNNMLRFSDIPKRQRVVRGLLAHLTIAGAERVLEPNLEVIRQAAVRVIGPSASAIEDSILNGGERGSLVVCGWYKPRTPSFERAVKAAFLAAGERDAAALWAERAIHGSPRRSSRPTADRKRGRDV